MSSCPCPKPGPLNNACVSHVSAMGAGRVVKGSRPAYLDVARGDLGKGGEAAGNAHELGGDDRADDDRQVRGDERHPRLDVAQQLHKWARGEGKGVNAG